MCVVSLSLPGSLMPLRGSEWLAAEESCFIPVSLDIQSLLSSMTLASFFVWKDGFGFF